MLYTKCSLADAASSSMMNLRWSMPSSPMLARVVGGTPARLARVGAQSTMWKRPSLTRPRLPAGSSAECTNVTALVPPSHSVPFVPLWINMKCRKNKIETMDKGQKHICEHQGTRNAIVQKHCSA